MAARPKALKVPFDVHGVVPRHQVVVKGAIDLALSPDAETFAVASRDVPVALFDRSAQSIGALESGAEHIAWSNDGKRIATLRGEWKGNDTKAIIEVHTWPGKERVATCELPNWGTVSHALCGSGAPVLAFGPNDTHLYIRSANMRSDEGKNVLGVLDIAKNELATHSLSDDSYLFSIAVDGDRVYALFSEAHVGLMVLDAKTLAVRSKAKISGEQVLPGKSGAWVIGDRAWAHRIGEGRPAVIRKADKERRWARLQELMHRAKAKWDVDHLKYLEGLDLDKPDASPGARALLHAEPWGIPQGERFGDDDLIVRDGVRVARWHEAAGELEVTPLIEDLQRATTAKGRHLLLSVRKTTLALGWRKAMNDDITVTLFDIE